MSDDTEITLGPGKVLFLFFLLVVVCALCFGLGFTFGRKTAGSDLASDMASAPSATQVAARSTSSKHTPPPADTSPQPEQLTFYKSVEQKDENPQLNTAASTTTAPAPAPSTEKPPEGTPLPGYIVQVAAVTKAEDAEALVSALKKKQYSVFTATNPPYDKLYHVQIGPFADVKEAEAIRTKLVSDGYNPILKR
ncbi:MAG TPA: SPOR domain-containing protein [Terriglobales bacterium]|nr:SPOR domain-containing protein [Terriglobales bacterium]